MFSKAMLYIFSVAFVGAAFCRIALFFVDFEVFRPIVSLFMGGLIGLFCVSPLKPTTLHKIVGFALGAAIGFVFFQPIGKVVLFVIYVFGLNPLLNTSPANYATLFGAAIGLLSGIIVSFFIALEHLNASRGEDYDQEALIHQHAQKEEERKLAAQNDEPKAAKPQPPTPATPNSAKAPKIEEKPQDYYAQVLDSPPGIALALAAKVTIKYAKNLDAAKIQKITNLFVDLLPPNPPANLGEIYAEIITKEGGKLGNVPALSVNLKALDNQTSKKILINTLLELVTSDAKAPIADDFIFQIAVNIGLETQGYFALRNKYGDKIKNDAGDENEESEAENSGESGGAKPPNEPSAEECAGENTVQFIEESPADESADSRQDLAHAAENPAEEAAENEAIAEDAPENQQFENESGGGGENESHAGEIFADETTAESPVETPTESTADARADSPSKNQLGEDSQKQPSKDSPPENPPSESTPSGDSPLEDLGSEDSPPRDSMFEDSPSQNFSNETAPNKALPCETPLESLPRESQEIANQESKIPESAAQGFEAPPEPKNLPAHGVVKALVTLPEDAFVSQLLHLYELLESTPEDDNATLKKNYRRLAANYHPDKYASKGFGEDALLDFEEKFKSINYAYSTLKKLREIV